MRANEFVEIVKGFIQSDPAGALEHFKKMSFDDLVLIAKVPGMVLIIEFEIEMNSRFSAFSETWNTTLEKAFKEFPEAQRIRLETLLRDMQSRVSAPA